MRILTWDIIRFEATTSQLKAVADFVGIKIYDIPKNSKYKHRVALRVAEYFGVSTR